MKMDEIATINTHLWEITIESPAITTIENEGSGVISCLDTLTGSALTVKHFSSGTTNILCNTPNLTTNFDAGGELFLNGNADTHALTHYGGGRVAAFDLLTNTCTLTVQGV